MPSSPSDTARRLKSPDAVVSRPFTTHRSSAPVQSFVRTISTVYWDQDESSGVSHRKMQTCSHVGPSCSSSHFEMTSIGNAAQSWTAEGETPTRHEHRRNARIHGRILERQKASLLPNGFDESLLHHFLPLWECMLARGCVKRPS